MTQVKSELPAYYLKAGELLIMEKPAIVSTVLGSCVAVTLFNRRLGFSGICHALMPQCVQKGFRHKVHFLPDRACHKCSEAYRYVECSVLKLADAFFRFGIAPRETEIMLFGGAQMLTSRNQNSVGRQNVGMAQKVIADCQLTLVNADVGGSLGRKIIFNTKTGEVISQLVKNTIFKEVEKEAFGPTSRKPG
jgi:chemotaxis protein CheD